ncbi:MAG: nucleotidyltransferase domain-containing protein [Deltaproteobacteria bacterium]|jgi:predicted nucleotidyltransferase|nr:nucleotidyltransferase domain-containing protein [Deltaproteobacteria bacterium]
MDLRVEQVLERLKNYKPEKIILFGSRAKKTFDPYSDIDLIIIKKTKKRFLDRVKDVIKIINPDFAIDIFVYTPGEFNKMISEGNSFLEYAIKDGQVLYEKL